MSNKDFTTEKGIHTKGNIGIGKENPTHSIDASTRTDGFVAPSGTTAQRVGTVRGTFRYNTSVGEFEGFNGTEWYNIAGRNVNAARLGGNLPTYYSSVQYVDETKDWLIQFVADSTAGVSSIDGVNGAITTPQLWGILGIIPQLNLPTRLRATATPTAEGTMSAADKTKLNGVETGATKNDTDANLRDRTTHTGTIPNTVVTGLGSLATRDNITIDMINANTGATTYYLLGRISDGSGAVEKVNISQGAFVNTIPIRLANGSVVVGNPTESNHAVTMSWATTQLSQKAGLGVATPTANGLMSAADKTTFNSISTTYATKVELTNGLNTKFDKPTGTSAQYLTGTGSVANFPAPTIINGLQGTIVIEGGSGIGVSNTGNRIIIRTNTTDLDPISGTLPSNAQIQIFRGSDVLVANANVFASAADGALARSAIQPATLTQNMNTKMNLSGGTFTGDVTWRGGIPYFSNGATGTQQPIFGIGNASNSVTTTRFYRQSDNSVTFDMYNASSGAWERTVLRIGHGGGVTAQGGLHNNGGDITCTGNIGAFSDIRLKSNVETIDNALELFCSFRGTTYIKDGVTQYGVIAQEVEAVAPDLVKESTDPSDEYAAKGERPTLYVNADNSFMAIAIEAMKEMKERIEALETEIKELRK